MSVDDDNDRTIMVLESFKEIDEVLSLIRSIPDIYSKQVIVEKATERMLFIIDKYQEQPHLLDPYLEKILQELLSHVRNPDSPKSVVHLSFKFLYFITKTRGHKVIIRLVPHEVADLEPLLKLLAEQDIKEHGTWETRYMLLIWLSIVCMIPFDMVKLDNTLASQKLGERQKPIMDRILEAGKTYLSSSDKCRDAAAYMLSRFLTRPDVKKKLPEVIDDALQIIHNSNVSMMDGMHSVNGVLSEMALLYKHGKREDLMDYAPTVLKEIIGARLQENNNTLLRKMGVKVVQRLGLCFLKARVATWRYDRGSRSLAANLGSDAEASEKIARLDPYLDEDEEYDVPEEIEDVIEYLLNGLRDINTIVRWSAAKGIGRVTGRLPRELADEVVESIMSLCTITETDSAWHGGCLALAELGRRGLLLPDRLPSVIPVIVRALNYDEKRGNCSVGANVRDAACYICWAFARAYNPSDLQPYVDKLANALVIVSVFDREVNVRRAAAAAFQENVGRQGQFANGIDILTTCDYYAVGQRKHCYLDLSVFVAQFDTYTKSLIDHLVKVKVNHWDVEVRKLAASALFNLTACAPSYIANTILPSVIEQCTSSDMVQRHGNILAAAQLTHALYHDAKKQNKAITDILSKDTIQGLRDISIKLQDAKLYKGYSGELMRKAVCSLIHHLSLSNMPFHGDKIVEIWKDFIEDCLEHASSDVQAAAVEAIPAFIYQYFGGISNTVDPNKQDTLIQTYMSKLKNPTESIRQGYALALGALPKVFVKGKLDILLKGLSQSIHDTEKELAMVESRRDHLLAMTRLCKTVGAKKNGDIKNEICEDNIQELFDVYFKAIGDYTLDSRGDVGVWVRKASMSGMESLIGIVMESDPSLLTPEIVHSVIGLLVQQAVEKIDRVRDLAGETFYHLLYYQPQIPCIPNHEELMEIFPREEVKHIWFEPSKTFPRFTKLLGLKPYKFYILLGMTVSVGGLSESLVMHSSNSLIGFFRSIKDNKSEMTEICENIIKIMTKYEKQERVILPMLKMLDQLLSRGAFSELEDQGGEKFFFDIIDRMKVEIARTPNTQKLLASIEVFCGLLQFNKAIQKRCLSQLCIFLCHRYPIVRKSAASKLYENILTYDGVVDDENLDEVTTILSDTLWDNPVAEVKPIRNSICELLDIKPPVATKGGMKQTIDSNTK